MTQPDLNPYAKVFRAAVEANDYSLAEAAMHNYITWFRSAPRTLAEVAHAKNLFTWGAEAAMARKARLAGELARVTRFFGGYRPSATSHTWYVEG